jgi:hypothetical protein
LPDDGAAVELARTLRVVRDERRSDGAGTSAGWQDVEMFLPTRRVAIAAVMAASLLAACTSDDSQSSTPQIGLDDDSSLVDRLLKPDDVALISGFDGVEVRDLEEFPVFENPDPRGPCGAPVSVPPLDGAAGRAQTGATIGLIQFVTPASPEYQAYITTLLTDQGPPCDRYTSETNTGEIQNVSEIVLYDADGEGVRGVAWTSLVEVDTKSIYLGVIAVEAAESIAFVQVQSAFAIPQEGMQLLTELAVLRLKGTG